LSTPNPPNTAAHSGSPSEPASTWRLMRRLLGLVWEYRSRCLLVLSQQLVLVSIGLAMLGCGGLGIDFIRFRLDPSATDLNWPLGIRPPSSFSDMATLASIAATVLLLATLHATLRLQATLSASRLAQNIIVNLRTRVYDKLQRLGFRYFDDHNSSSLINRAAGDVYAVRMFVDGVMIEMIVVFLSLTIYTVYMLSMHVTLTLACLATTPLLWTIAIRFSQTIRPMYLETRNRIDQLVRDVVDNIQGVSVVKGCAQQESQIEKFRHTNHRIREQQHNIFWRISLFQPTMGMLTHVNRAVLLGFGGYLVAQGEFPLGVGLVAFARLLQQFSEQVGQITNIANRIQTSLAGAERVFHVLDAPIEIYSPPQPQRMTDVRGAVQFEGVSFAYDAEQTVLKGIDLTIQPGQCVAIVGPTGSGKTTLLSLIPRLYDATQGSVRIDGMDVRQLHLDDLRRHVGVVFQESFLFSNTVAANIAFGNPIATEPQIASAAQLAAAAPFITHLSDSYNTIIGEHGCDLSGGERQRVAIARALLMQSPILLLDDPTAAVDPETEQEILQAVQDVMCNRTTFLVTHRLSTIRRADLVVVLLDGTIAQLGPPEELLQQDGYLRSLLAAQAENVDSAWDEKIFETQGLTA